MADDMDRAQAMDSFDREVALSNLRTRLRAAAVLPRDTSVDKECIDCEQPIERKRLIALRGTTSRCADCAKQFEQRVRLSR